ncbi:MAG: translation initiation factor IF-2 [Chloroflexi bacterium]|nr:translation initiation factor IF-2 [Chloroflexota bacterium]
MLRQGSEGQAGPGQAPAAPKPRPVELPQLTNVRQLADILHTSPIDVIKQLMRNGIMANINQVIDFEMAAQVAAAFGYQVRMKRQPKSAAKKVKSTEQLREEEAAGLKLRPPVVAVMGHVDHGKTRTLDAIRQTNVMASEAGQITQHIGAYQVEVDGRKISFLDTPGHEAFTAMRAHGAQITDIAVLVVAADDGVQPQTLEAIDHARAANVPIVVAINKIDKANANPDLVKQQLADAGLVIEEWGGDVIAVPISAKEKKGISELLENILLVAEMQELKASPGKPATGVVIEAGMDKNKGPLATVLVQDGTLRPGNIVVVGDTWGKIKAMYNDTGKQVRKAEPAAPVEILGLSSVPKAGDTMTVVASEHHARAMIQKRERDTLHKHGVSLDNLYKQITAGQVKELNIILKTDVQGSIEPIRKSLEQLSAEQVQIRIIRSGTGDITESDVMLAAASKGLVIGFNVSVDTGARKMAEMEGVDIRVYDIIYTLRDDVEKAMKGMLEPTYVDVVEGHAEVRAVFAAGKKEKAAGVIVSDGRATRSSLVRVWRKKQLLIDSTISSLRRFKEDAKEVTAGYECGIGVKGFSEFEVGDVLEFYKKEKAGSA